MKKGQNKHRRGATVELNHRDMALLHELVDLGVYGKTTNEVGRYLIRRQIDDLMRTGVLKP